MAATVLTLSAGGCAPRAVEPRGPTAAGPGFSPAPGLTAARRLPGGGVRLEGRGPADATVRLLSPDGRSVGVTSDATGAWSFDLPAAAEPRMWALSAEAGGRAVRAEGALAVLPPPAAAPALLARAGAPAAPASGGGDLHIAAVDFDAGGGLAVAGGAAPGAPLRLLIDGQPAGEGRADAAGRFGLLGVGAPARPGPHVVRVEGRSAVAQAAVDTAAAPPPGPAPFRATRLSTGWRLDWSPPGGGVQSLFAPDAPGGAR